MKILFFASPTCKRCAALLMEMEKAGIKNISTSFIYVNAMDDGKKEFCDEHNVDELPHIKVYHDKRGLIFEKIGLFDVQEFKKMIQSSGPEETKVFNLLKQIKQKS